MKEILIKGQLHKFKTFEEFAREFDLGKRDLIVTNEFIYNPFIKDLALDSQVVFQEKFGTSEPSEEMITDMFAALDPADYDRVIAVGGGAIMDICKVLSLKRPATVHDLYFKKFDVIPEKELIAIPTTCGTGSEVTNISVVIVKDDKVLYTAVTEPYKEAIEYFHDLYTKQLIDKEGFTHDFNIFTTKL